MRPEALVLMIPIVAIISGTVLKMAKLKYGAGRGIDGDVGARLQALEDEVHALRGELAETQERLDFTERLLAQGKSGS